MWSALCNTDSRHVLEELGFYTFTIHFYLDAGRASAMSQGMCMLSPVMAHVEALKTLSKKEDSLRQSFQTLDKHQDMDINLPSDLDTPQCSRMVRDIENALREGVSDGCSRQGTSLTQCCCNLN